MSHQSDKTLAFSTAHTILVLYIISTIHGWYGVYRCCFHRPQKESHSLLKLSSHRRPPNHTSPCHVQFDVFKLKEPCSKKNTIMLFLVVLSRTWMFHKVHRWLISVVYRSTPLGWIILQFLYYGSPFLLAKKTSTKTSSQASTWASVYLLERCWRCRAWSDPQVAPHHANLPQETKADYYPGSIRIHLFNKLVLWLLS